MRIVAYLTHPLGMKQDTYTRGNNIESAFRWIKWLVLSTPWAISAPWLTNLIAHDEELMRPRYIVNQLQMMRRSDVLLLVGGEISPHMRFEHSYAGQYNHPVIDATELGTRPPEPGSEWEQWLLSKAVPQIPLDRIADSYDGSDV